MSARGSAAAAKETTRPSWPRRLIQRPDTDATFQRFHWQVDRPSAAGYRDRSPYHDSSTTATTASAPLPYRSCGERPDGTIAAGTWVTSRGAKAVLAWPRRPHRGGTLQLAHRAGAASSVEAS